MSSGVIEDFLKRKSSKEGTKRVYRIILKGYFKCLGVKEEDIDNYFNSGRNYTEDIWAYADYIKEKAPKTQQYHLACVKVFLERYDVELKKRNWQDIYTRNGIRGAKPVFQKRTPNNADMKKILSHGDIKSRTLFVFACTTGMRIEEVLSLTFADIDMDNRHARIKGELTKNHRPRDTFFTPEAKELLEEWKKERSRYLLVSYKKSHFLREHLRKLGYKVEQKHDIWYITKDGRQLSKEDIIDLDPRVFPFNYDNAAVIWHNLLENAGHPYNQKDGIYYMYNIHSLRRFWFTQLESSGANINHINFMGGHESELNATYTHFEFRDLKETYDENMNYLSIFSDMKMVEKAITPKLQNQEHQINLLARENINLKQDAMKVSEELDRLKKYVYYSIGVPPYSDEQLKQRKDLEGFLPQVTEDEMKFIKAYRDRSNKKKSQATQS